MKNRLRRCKGVSETVGCSQGRPNESCWLTASINLLVFQLKLHGIQAIHTFPFSQNNKWVTECLQLQKRVRRRQFSNDTVSNRPRTFRAMSFLFWGISWPHFQPNIPTRESHTTGTRDKVRYKCWLWSRKMLPLTLLLSALSSRRWLERCSGQIRRIQHEGMEGRLAMVEHRRIL